MEKQNRFRIKDFGNDKAFEEPGELLDCLSKDYRGRSVVVECLRDNGLWVRVLFVDVRQDGAVHETYGNRERFTGSVMRSLMLDVERRKVS